VNVVFELGQIELELLEFFAEAVPARSNSSEILRWIRLLSAWLGASLSCCSSLENAEVQL